MGMFDTVYIDCPYCEKSVECQTKSGDCVLSSFGLGTAPLNVLHGVVGLNYCDHCNKKFMVDLIHKPIVVQRKLTDDEERNL